MADLIDRQTAIETAIEAAEKWDGGYSSEWEGIIRKFFDKVPAVQPATSCSEIPNGSDDTISRQTAIEAIDRLDIPEDMCVFEILSHIELEIGNLPAAQPETAKRIVGKSRDGMTLWYQCDMCNEPVDVQDSYCRGCGRRLIDE